MKFTQITQQQRTPALLWPSNHRNQCIGKGLKDKLKLRTINIIEKKGDLFAAPPNTL